MQKLSTETFAARCLAKLAWAVCHRRGWFLYPQIVLSVLCIGYTVKFLKFDTSRNDLVGGDKKYHQNFLEFRKEFPVQDDLVVVVESENAEKNRQFVERRGVKLEREAIQLQHAAGRPQELLWQSKHPFLVQILN